MANNAENIVTKNTNLAKYIYDRVQLMKSVKGDAMYEVINGSEFSYYGIRYYGGKYTEQWLKATYDDNGNVTATNHEVSIDYAIGLYDSDYMLIGTFVLPFLIRGGYWDSGAANGVFSTHGTGGSAFSGNGFRPVVVL